MEDEPSEVALSGGNVNTVVKAGNTVRRKMSPQSPNIHALLLHLEAKNVASPRFLGIDEEDREILLFIEGATDFPKNLWDNEDHVVASAKLLRDLHDASLDFIPPEPGNWAYAYPDKCQHEVINHNDFAPYNMVFGVDGATAIIDFDLSGPGPRCRDLAYLAYWMTPLSFGVGDLQKRSEAQLRNGCPRLSLLCATYGFDDLEQVLAMVSDVLHHMSDEGVATSMIGEEAAERLKLGGHFKHWSNEAFAFDEKLPALVSELSARR
ncbi:aminoglycoside phosphotransferase family protein [Qingshengfaniella alkalisoli]|nr:aminoglycoside phosphotransferase family protein [Qingshengfaniella alkalisoli]